MGDRTLLGKSGEDRAADFLRKSGYRILARNVRNYLGEIDIVARQKNTICFVEVRTRRGTGDPREVLESIGRQKQNKLSKLALCFLKEHDLLESRSRFDVVGILVSENKEEIVLIKNAFNVV